MPATIISLVNPNGSTAAERALLTEVTSDNGVPTESTDGVRTRGKRFAHIVIEADGAADWSLYVWCDMSEQWMLDTALGVNGIVTVASGTTWNVRETLGVERAYIRAVPQGVGVKVSAWIGTVAGYGSADG